MAGEGCAFEQTFSFTPLPAKTFSFQQDKDTLNLLMKWSMLGRISAQAYSFDSNFHPYSCETFALCFFKDPKVIHSLRNMEDKLRVPLGTSSSDIVELVPCTKISMELFDPIFSCGILRPSGDVVKCFHDVYPDFDELRQMLQEEDSEHYYVVGKTERKEFLFCLFKHLCLGGELCQYEDNIDPYISTTKKLYKDLIRICLSLHLPLLIFKCYKTEQTFAYLIVDPVKRNVTLFYHIFGMGKFTL
uniref:Cilia- and flagella-associated protein 300 n=1 Tax=Cyprinodon variegatus TaxID=28743 RepID=A0A3Q2CM94_CYPVA